MQVGDRAGSGSRWPDGARARASRELAQRLAARWGDNGSSQDRLAPAPSPRARRWTCAGRACSASCTTSCSPASSCGGKIRHPVAGGVQPLQGPPPLGGATEYLYLQIHRSKEFPYLICGARGPVLMDLCWPC
ncbi:hypothetical protein BDA96_01G137300 [Sorghum bicolor]|uniref:Uncharacterized protein n=2 Tax=Sorghum bicolor TaxID=4558 RepID=A0A921UXI5_SORBI|nr:hypothetical protein BDA96_01G137300 [Sorghum bicolor]KXG37814.1 hypothetical protein SORBI_3001G131500 [Sorghum bicolor]